MPNHSFAVNTESSRDAAKPACNPLGVHHGERLKMLREGVGLSRREVAKNADVTAEYIGQIERGVKPGSVRILRRIARSLGVNLEELIGEGNQVLESIESVGNKLGLDTVVVRHGGVIPGIRVDARGALIGNAPECAGHWLSVLDNTFSAEPLVDLLPGDTLVFDPSAEPALGDYVLLQTPDGAELRHYVEERGRRYFWPVVETQDPLRESDDVQVVAVAVELRRPLRGGNQRGTDDDA